MWNKGEKIRRKQVSRKASLGFSIQNSNSRFKSLYSKFLTSLGLLRFHTTFKWHHKATKFKIYKKWHDYKYSHHTHVATAVIFFILIVLNIASILTPLNYQNVYAANGTFSQTTFNGTSDGTYTSTIPMNSNTDVGLPATAKKNTNITYPGDSSGGNVAPSIARDSSNNVHIVWKDVGNVYYSMSSDEGTTWSARLSLDNNASNMYPQILIDSANNLNIIWSRAVADSYQIYHRRKVGGTWGSTITVCSGSGDECQLYSAAAIDASNNIYLVSNNAHLQGERVKTWNGSGWSASSIFYDANIDSVYQSTQVIGTDLYYFYFYGNNYYMMKRVSGSWSGPSAVTAFNNAGTIINTMVDKDNNLWAFVYDATAATTKFSRYVIGTSTWDSWTILDGSSVYAQSTMDTTGNIYVFYNVSNQIFYKKRTYAGGAWGSAVQVTTSGVDGAAYLPAVRNQKYNYLSPDTIDITYRIGASAPYSIYYAKVAVAGSSSGTYATNSISPTGLYGNWGTLSFTKTTPANTTLTVDVLNGANGSVIQSNVSTGSNLALSTTTYPSIKLRANLGSTDPAATPLLSDWSLTYNYDTTAPTAPSGLTVGAVTPSTVPLSWTASTDSESGVAGYEVQRAPDSGGSPGTWGAVSSDSACYGTAGLLNAISCTDSSVSSPLSANTKYWYRVRAKDVAGNYSGYSGEMNADTNVKGLWHMNEGTGGTTADVSGSGNTVTMNGSGYWGTTGADRRFGDAAYTNSGTNYISGSHNTAITLNGTYTFEAWIKTSSTGNQTIFQDSNSASDRNGMTVKTVTGAAVLSFGYYNGSTYTSISGALNYGEWAYVVGVNNGGTLSLYINGQEQIGNTTPPYFGFNTGFYIGRANGSVGLENYFIGQIDEVRLSNVARSGSDILAYYNESNPNPKSALTLTATPSLTAPATPQNTLKPTIAGTGATPATTVRLYDNGTQKASVTADGSGNFTFNAATPGYTDLSEGDHTNITVRGYNGAAETPDSSPARTVFVDTQAPTAPTTREAAKVGSAGGDDITNNAWNGHNNTATVYFEWSGATDPAPASHVKRYWVYFGSNVNAIPRTDGQVTADSIANATKTLASPVSGTNYYLRIQTEDNAGNISSDGSIPTLFTYKFDNTPPDPIAYVTPNPAGWAIAGPWSFSWPTGTDSNSGVAGYEYKRDNGEAWTLTTNLSVAGINNYQSGVNRFILAVEDNAGNYSTPIPTNYYYAGNIDAPANLAVDLSQSAGQTINSFKFTWDAPGGVDVAAYHYSVNSAPNTNNTTRTTNDFTPFYAAATQEGLNTFYVVTEDTDGNIGWTNYAETNFSINTVAPDVPVDVSITDASNRATSMWALTVAWSPLASPTADFNGYVVEKSTDGLIFSSVATVTTNIYSEAGLSNSTTYYYRIRSRDNVGKTSDPSAVVQKMPTGKYITPPTYTSEPKAEPKATAVTVTWTTNRATNSIVQYGTTTAYGQEVSKSTEAVTDHSIDILGLTPGITYHFRVQSLDADRDYDPSLAFSADYTFETSQAPGISNVNTTEIRLYSAIITWKTTSSSTSKILYGKTTSYGQTYIDNSGSATTTHTVKLDGLTDSTTYHYRIQGTDIEGNVLVSDDYVFETLTFPKLSDLRVSQVPNTPTSTVKVAFDSNVPTSTFVTLSGAGGKEVAKYDLETTHEIQITGLKDNTQYTITARGRDQYGNEATSLGTTYKTDFDTRPPLLTDITVETSITGYGVDAKGQIVVSWNTDEPGTSQLEYGEGVAAQEYLSRTQEDTSLTENHVVIISDLKPSAPYHFRAVSRDGSGNTGKSADNSVLTQQASESIIDIIIKSLQSTIGWIFNVFSK
jgi:hypothetical protein